MICCYCGKYFDWYISANKGPPNRYLSQNAAGENKRDHAIVSELTKQNKDSLWESFKPATIDYFSKFCISSRASWLLKNVKKLISSRKIIAMKILLITR